MDFANITAFSGTIPLGSDHTVYTKCASLQQTHFDQRMPSKQSLKYDNPNVGVYQLDTFLPKKNCFGLVEVTIK